MLNVGSILLLLCVASTQAFYTATGCTLDLVEDVRHPIILIQQGKDYILPEDKSTFQVTAGEQLLLYCPTANNKFKLFANVKELNAYCVQDQTLQVSTTQYKFNQLECFSMFYGDYTNTGTSCANKQGIIYQVGYNVTSTNSFYKLYEVCHQQSTGITFYTQHVYHKYSKPGETEKLKEPKFYQGAYYTGMKQIYQHQKDILIALIGSTQTDQVLSAGTNLSRGHLTPSADFIFSGNRRTTYQLINHAPQWESINSASWNQLEQKIRKKAFDKMDLQIITGTHGVLRLPNDKGVLTKIYLDGNKVPVPEVFWKVVYNGNKGIAFISVNSPIKTDHEQLCPINICNANMWGDWSDYKKGLIYCCKVSEFKDKISYIPIPDITEILTEK